jgi:hypothetical protein
VLGVAELSHQDFADSLNVLLKYQSDIDLARTVMAQVQS